MSNDDSKAIYFISVASTLSGIHQQTIRTYEQKGLIKPFRTGGGTRRYSQEDIDKLEIGMTKDQVSFVMGQPSFENFFEKNVWNYIYKITTGQL